MFLGSYSCPPYPKINKGVVFVGRSNVGKSSLINHLTGIKNLAKTSATPGKTQQINFFFIQNRYYFVDLPGYGFAKASKAKQHGWGKNIERFFETTGDIAVIVQLLDIRHPPSQEDLQMIEWSCTTDLPILFVLTKLDKIVPTKQMSTIQSFMKELEEIVEEPTIIPYTIKDSAGKERLLKLIQKATK
jgi:GTP-binding protein